MTTTPRIDRRAILISAILLFLLVTIAGGMGVYLVSDRSLEQSLTMIKVAYNIDRNYPDQVDWSQVVRSGREAMFEELDRYSSYFQHHQFEQLDEELEGSYSGIGVSVISHEEGLLIMSVQENGPAAEVGLLSGDIIVGADSIRFDTLRSADSQTRFLRGKEGTDVLVRIHRPASGEEFEVPITRRKVPFVHIPFAGLTEDSVLYIRILDFEAGTAEDLKQAIDSLLPRNPKGILLDLRGNPGGLFSEAYRTADLFLPKGTFLVGTDGRSRWNDRVYRASERDYTNGLPIGVLVDNGSASSAEIVAGALQSAGRAVLVGDTTFGKGLVQGFVRFPDGDGLKLTISRYYFDGGVYLNDFDSTLHDTGHGLVPNRFFRSFSIDPFLRDLENSMVIREFAQTHQEGIIESTQSGDTLDDRWIDLFRDHVEARDLSPQSLRSRYAQELLEISGEDGSLRSTRVMAQGLLSVSLLQDRLLYLKHRNYLKYRLMQTAYERKFGTYRTYRDVILRMRPDIPFATNLILESRRG